MKALAAASALLLAAAAAAGDFSAAARGTSAAQFLDLPVGARAAAMGGAAAAISDDATALYWNPADIASVERRTISLMHNAYIASSYQDYIGYVQNGEQWGVFGISLDYFSAGAITQLDDSGNALGNYFPYDMALSFGYARKASGLEALSALNGWSFGAAAKLVDSKVLASASAGALDVGFRTRPYLDGRVWFAACANNLGGDTMQFESAQDKLPMSARIGAAYAPAKLWLLSADFVAPRADRPYGAVGTEYWFAEHEGWRLAARAGFSSQQLGSVDGLAGVSMGFGLGVRGWSVDYAFAPVGGLGQAHRLSLGYAF